MDDSVGPLSVEVLEGLQSACGSLREPTEWGVAADLTFTGAVAALEEPRTFVRRYGRVIQDVSRYAQVGTWEGTITAAGTHVRRRPPTGRRARATGRGACARSASPSTRASRCAAAQDGYGFRHDWLPMQFDDHMLKVQIDQDTDGNRSVESRHGCGTSATTARSRSSGRPEVTIDYLPGTGAGDAGGDGGHRARRPTGTDDPGDEHAAAHALPLAAGSGYVNLDGWGHGVYQGPLKVEGLVHDLSDPEERRKYAVLNETLCRFELSTGEVGYGMHENLLAGIYRPTGFLTPDAVAP